MDHIVRVRWVADIDVHAFSGRVREIRLDVLSACSRHQEQTDDKKQAHTTPPCQDPRAGAEPNAACLTCSTRVPRHDGRLLPGEGTLCDAAYRHLRRSCRYRPSEVTQPLAHRALFDCSLRSLGLARVAAAFLTHSQTKRVWDVSDPAHTQGTFQPGLSSQTPPQYWPLASANAASTGAPPC